MKKNYKGLLLIAMLVGVLVGCGAPVATTVPEVVATVVEAPVALDLNLKVSEVEALWQDDAITIVDVREDFEWDAGHIPGATWIPLGELPDRLDEIPADEPVVMVCRSGNRSSQALNFLRDQGFDNVHNMLDGMNGWTAMGYEIEK
jgi:rhodanese-related sulfurtransferase